MKKVIKYLFAILLVLSLNSIGVSANGPLDGQVIDGSLLTSDESAMDERPLLSENSTNGIVPYGTYLSNGASEITNQGNGVVYVSGRTYCYRNSDKVQIYLYLQKLTNNGWTTIKTHSNVAYNTHVVSTGLSFSVAKGYYYRVKGTHIAKKGSTVESCNTCTNAIYIN